MDPYEKYYTETVPSDIVWNKLPNDGMYNTLQDLGIEKESLILSAGCGMGRLELYCAEKGYTKIHAFDLSLTAIEYAKKVQQKALQKKSFKPVAYFVHNLFSEKSNLKIMGLGNISCWVDWLCFHNMSNEQHEAYAHIFSCLNTGVSGNKPPKKVLIHGFSKTDLEYLEFQKAGGKGDVLSPNVAGVYRHYLDEKYVKNVFSYNYNIESSFVIEGYDDNNLTDRRVSDKITILLSRKPSYPPQW